MAKIKIQEFEFPCYAFQQGDQELIFFTAKASVLWNILQISQRDEDKDIGYQRALSPSRARAVAKYVDDNKPLPLSILVSLDKANLTDNKKTLVIQNVADAGWVIDGQHRLAGANQAINDIQLPVIAFINLDEEAQIEQFITINKEAKGVPSSLYLDLLHRLPPKMKPADIAKERAADLADDLRKDESSPFYNRIVVTMAPRRGQLSLTNFVRKVAPLVMPEKGILHQNIEREQRGVISNYYKALENIFSKEFNKTESIFFRTLGFGALMNALPVFFIACLKRYKGFTVDDATAVMKEIEDFEFSKWKEFGTGNAAEISAGNDFREALTAALETIDGDTGTLRV